MVDTRERTSSFASELFSDIHSLHFIYLFLLLDDIAQTHLVLVFFFFFILNLDSFYFNSSGY